MTTKQVARVLWIILFVLFGVLYIAAKVNFFRHYQSSAVIGYLRNHSIYWAAIAVVAGLMWLLERPFVKKPH